MRIGFGIDSHAFAKGDHVMIGGVRVPHNKGVRAHSDGDVLLHALVDALLGAAALGDIGQHFPDTDPQFANASSDMFVTHTINLLSEKKYSINNVDATVILEAPRLAQHIPVMRNTIAELLQLPIDCVNVKATTNEKMGWIGRGEGLSAHVVVLLQS